MSTIEPVPRAAIRRAAACAVKKVPFALTSMTAS